MEWVGVLHISNGVFDYSQRFQTEIKLDINNLSLCGLFLSEPNSIENLGELLDECEEKLDTYDLDQNSFSALIYGNKIIIPWIGMDPLEDFTLTQIDEILDTVLQIAKTFISSDCELLKQVYGWRKKLSNEKINTVKSELITDISLKDLECITLQNKLSLNLISKQNFDIEFKKLMGDKTQLINKAFDTISKYL